MTARRITPDEAAALVPSGAVVTVCGSSALNCPDRMLRALGERFAREGTPRDLTLLHPIAAGDMYGVKGIDHLAQPGLIGRVLAGSYPSGPSSMPSPRIWEMIANDQVAAYNVPSGILYDMHRDAAARRAGVLTQVGLDTFVDPRRQGCKMNAAAAADIVRLVEFDGQEWLHFRNIPPDVAILRGTTADERGNISMEHEGAVLGIVDQALAARANGGFVIAQVKRLTTAGAVPPHHVHLPSTLVDYVVVDPDQVQTTETVYDPAISGEVRRPLGDFEAVPFGLDKVIARRAAMELAQGDVVNLGFGISALIPQVLIEEGLHGQVTWSIEQGAVGGVPLTGFAFGCSANAEAIVQSPQQFTFFQGGGADCALLSFLEVDTHGNVNVSRLEAKLHVTAGVGGFIDITAHGRRLVFSGYFSAGGLKQEIADAALRIDQDGRFTKFVEAVQHVTFSGRRAATLGQEVVYVTERGVFRLTPTGLVLEEAAPGIDVQRDIVARSAAPVTVSGNLRPMDARLFRPERMGLELKPPRRRQPTLAVAAQ